MDSTVFLSPFWESNGKGWNFHSPSDQDVGTNKYLLGAVVPIIEIQRKTLRTFLLPPGTSQSFSPLSILLPLRGKKCPYPFIRLIPSGLPQELPLLNPPTPFIFILSFSITASPQPTNKLKSPIILKKKIPKISFSGIILSNLPERSPNFQ